MNQSFKDKMLKDNPSFCMYPWIHLHTTPEGKAAPCCIARSCIDKNGLGSSREKSLMELVNSEKMKKLRLDMLAGIQNDECQSCYEHEDLGIRSSRKASNINFSDDFDEVIKYTNFEDGSLTKFEMKYFDIRFSNICNFKCRSCGAGYSSQWEYEDLKHKLIGKSVPKNDNPKFLEDVIAQIPYMKVAYFAGGEPLITEEHYILLEEMIRQKKTDIQLIYNTNLSNLRFKNKDLLSLWKSFDKKIDIYASIDHYGERAEYIRHGTNWGQVEENFLLALSKPFINIQMNTVVTVYNYMTLYDFYEYIITKNMLKTNSYTYSLYNALSPEYLNCQVLPEHLKKIGSEKVNATIDMIRSYKDPGSSQDQIVHLTNTLNWANDKHLWDQYKEQFRNEVKRLDNIRNENFEKTFPELAELMHD